MQTPTKSPDRKEPVVNYSNPRVRSFFKFDPIEFSDDVICSLSFYINNAIDTINSLLTKVEVSENIKLKFQNDLITKLQNSIDVNADKFELYIMRNIFDISVNIDLTPDIDTPKKVRNSDKDGLDDFDDDDNDFDDTELNQNLTDLYEQIQDAQAQRVQLVTSIKSNKAKLYEANELLKRMPSINKIIELAEQLPASEIEGLAQRIKDLLDRVKELEDLDENEKRSVEFDKASFTFD